MKGIVKGLIAAGLGLALVAKPASAQKPGAEFGMQFVSFNYTNPDGSANNFTNFGLGNGNVSVAFYMSDMIALEPTVLYSYTKDEGASNATTGLGLRLAVPIYLKRGWGKDGGLFVAPYGGWARISSGGSSLSQAHFGADLGTKLKVANDVFWRMQAGVEMGLENKGDNVPKYTELHASFGLSVYLH